MKQTFVLLLSIAFFAAPLSAQKANVSKAKNKALSVESPDFKGARELINLALEDETTKNLANTWYVAGLIGYKESENLYTKAQLGQNIDNLARGKAILESYAYFLKADELAQIPNEKGKVDLKIRKDIMPKIQEYYQPHNLISYGALLYENTDFAGAYKAFKTYIEIPDLSMFQDPKEQAKMPRDTIFSQIKYYAALSASNAPNMKEEAIALFTDLKDESFETLTVYQLLYQEYYNLKDTANYIQVLKEGFNKFPTEPWFLQNLINHFIFAKQTEEALVYLTNAIEKEPNVAQYHYVKGNIDETLGNAADAIVDFQNAINLEPNLADAWAGLGRVYFNKAVKIQEDASHIKDQGEYESELKKAQEEFKLSLPYFQKASELNPEERDFKMTLRMLYYRLNMIKEYDAINKDLNLEE